MYKGDKVKWFLVYILMYMLSLYLFLRCWWMFYDGNKKEKNFLKCILVGIICYF